MQPVWTYASGQTKQRDGHQGQNPSSSTSMLTTGLEGKPLLPSVFRPNSELYTKPLNVASTIGGLTNPNISTAQSGPLQYHSNHAAAYAGFNSPNVSAIRPQGSTFGTNIPANLQVTSGNFFMPANIRGQNMVPPPRSCAPILVQTHTSTLEAYTNAPVLPYKRHPGHPFTFPNTGVFHEQFNPDLGNQSSTNQYQVGHEIPVMPAKQVLPVQSNVIEINVADDREQFTDVFHSKNSLPYSPDVQANELIHNPSLASNTLVEPREYLTDHYNRPSIESKPLIKQADPSNELDGHRIPFESNVLSDENEHSSDIGDRRHFFGIATHSSDHRSPNSPVGSLDENDTFFGCRPRDFTSSHRESIYARTEDDKYSIDNPNNTRLYLPDDDQIFSYFDGGYSTSENQSFHCASPSYDEDVTSRSGTKYSNSYEKKQSVHVRNRYVHSTKRNFDSVAGYDRVEKDSSRRLYHTNKYVPNPGDRLSKTRASERQSYSRESSRTRSQSPPFRRHRSPLGRNTGERAHVHRDSYGDSRETSKLRNERHGRSSSQRKEFNQRSPRKRDRKESSSPCRKRESASRESNVQNKRSESRSSESTGKSETSKRSSIKRSSDKDDKEKTTSRALKCFCLPEPYMERKFVYEQSSSYYQASSTSQKSTCTGTNNLAKLHTEFENKVLKIVTVEDCPNNPASTPADSPQNQEEDRQYVSELLSNNADDETTDVSSESDIDLEGYDVIDVYDSESSDDDVMPAEKEERFENQRHPRKLHPELWFNVEGELNQGKECLCCAKDKEKWIVHNVYPNEKLPKACEAMGNNGLQLYHYWVTVFPHPNFMTENPTAIESNGQTYTFEGFSLLSHSPLDVVPRCFLTRFNFKYEIFFIQEPIPNNFCIKDLELFSKFLFCDILEMHDWKIGTSEESNDSCNLFHFLPRFTRKIGVSDDGCEKYELLSMRKVLEHLVKSHKPLLNEKVLASDRGSWREFVGSCVNSIVTRPGWKPSSIRIDDIDRGRDKNQPVIVHHGIRPVQLSFSGDPKCQKLMRKYLKMRALITNKPDASEKERLKLIKMKLTLDNMKMKDSLRRNCCVRVSTVGMIKTGLNSDVTQHALLLPVLAHHVRYHLSLQSFDEKIDYVFKDRSLLQLALTHPSYVMNYGTNPDHARNTLSNCGVKQPRYGDRRNRLSHTKKKGIVQLIDIMAKLEDLDGSQSFIQHNERLEFLGDAILEFICTCHLYFLFPDMAEGGLVTHRSSLVQNKHLAQVAKKLGLDNFIQFSHGPDLCHEEDMEHAMANCLEAILGAIYLDSDVSTVQKVFCKLAFEETELRKLWCSLPRHPLQEQEPEGDRQLIASYDLLKGLVKLEEAVGFQFKHIRLLARAFTHPQVGFNNLTLGNNQRMELLGDSLVQWIVTDYLYRYFPEHHEGHLTLLRSSLVNRAIQAQVAGEIGLDQHVHFGAGPGMPKLRQKHMSDLFEAFLAAMFVDKGIEPVEVFCKVCLFPRLRNVIVNQEWMDAKSQLQSCCLTQSTHPDNVPVYKVLKNVGSPNMKFFTVGVYCNGRRLGTGFGDSIREAEMVAAQNALATNYFPEYARQKNVIHRKHNSNKRSKTETK